MEDYVYRKEIYKGYTIKIEFDTAPESPLNWDHLGVIYSNCRDFNPHERDIDEILVADENGEKRVNKDYIYLNVYAYIHSGIALSTSRGGQFSDPWDSGLAGIIAVHKDDVIEEYGDLSPETIEKVYSVLKGEVEEWDNYYSGNVFGFVIEDEDDCRVDSCWGYYGGSDYCLSEAKSVVDYFVKKEQEEADRVARIEGAIEPFWID